MKKNGDGTYVIRGWLLLIISAITVGSLVWGFVNKHSVYAKTVENKEMIAFTKKAVDDDFNNLKGEVKEVKGFVKGLCVHFGVKPHEDND